MTTTPAGLHDPAAAPGRAVEADPHVLVRGLSKVFRRGGRSVTALEGVEFTVTPGEFVTVLGPSGCGKSTLLHILGGFEEATTGDVAVAGSPVKSPGRDRGMVFQRATLFPWWNIQRNIAWPLEVGGMNRKEARARADELIELVGLTGFGEAFPGELSGGMQQRAGIARTLSLEPEVLLMDEPFGALDAQTRELMQEELNRIWQNSGTTVVFITHDIHEAVFLADRVLVMSGRPGKIIADVPIDIERPRGHDVKSGAKFAEYHAQLWELLRDEAIAAETRGRG